MPERCYTSRRLRTVYWLCAAILALTLKQFYSAASAAQLQWLLYPLVLLLEAFSDLDFELDANYLWQDKLHRISIVKSCAGMNFLIMSLLAYFWQWRNKPFAMRLVLRVLLSAWLTALLANSARILLCIYCQEPLAFHTAISAADSHRLIGIAGYFLCLWAQLSAFRCRNFRLVATTALPLYLTIAVLVPLVRAWVLGLATPDIHHLLWVTGIPIVLTLISRISITWTLEKVVRLVSAEKGQRLA
ncbi:MAG: exosortase K [Methylomonas sp.]|jgi:exosortase K|uniref:exosortase K n=1 Tax=Methylomonas sp. TaxID=418 RepID=UPI0025E75927|nr:exosortase K [Methylomonas sp.]MCK9608404.1 exosortase K [Methylomonas sp.]